MAQRVAQVLITALACAAPVFAAGPITLICTEVQNRVPQTCVRDLKTFYAKAGRLFAWSSFGSGEAGQEFQHVWLIDGKEVSTARLHPTGARWRGVSSLRIPKDHPTDVTLQLRGENGNLLREWNLKTAFRSGEYVARVTAESEGKAVTVPAGPPTPPAPPPPPVQQTPAPMPEARVAPPEEPLKPTPAPSAFAEGFRTHTLNLRQAEAEYSYFWEGNALESGTLVLAWVPEINFANRALVGGRVGATWLEHQGNYRFFAAQVDVHPGYVISPTHEFRVELPLGVQIWDGAGTNFSYGVSLALGVRSSYPVARWIGSVVASYQHFSVGSLGTQSVSFGVRKTF